MVKVVVLLIMGKERESEGSGHGLIQMKGVVDQCPAARKFSFNSNHDLLQNFAVMEIHLFLHFLKVK